MSVENRSKKTPKIKDRSEVGSVAEGIINRQLHHEIEQRKQAERALQDALEYSRGIVDTIHESLLVLNSDLRVISANRFFYRHFGVKPEETEKQYIYALGNQQWDIPELRELLERILPEATSFDNFEVAHEFPDIGKRKMLLNAREIHQKARRTRLILLAIEDVTASKDLEEKLKILASHDELTGCLNFRAIMEALEKEIVRSTRYQKKFSIIMLDIDFFKRINDEYGHLAGNDALAVFARVVKNSVRNIDTVGRYGGEEFLIVLPETDLQHSLPVFERIRKNLERTKVSSPHVKKEKEIALRFSAGIAVFPGDAKNTRELIWCADSALRQAKQAGGDRAASGRKQ
jgi:diguanylate cyclase (GGDEF)-like protein/PAS domain S-box-containing protein